MRCLVIDDEAKERIAAVKYHAEQNFITLEQMREIIAGTREPAGDIEGYSTWLEVGYKVAFTIEKQPPGWVRHLSVSVDDPKKIPNANAMTAIMALFGFRSNFETTPYQYIEEQISPRAVNVLELLEVK